MLKTSLVFAGFFRYNCKVLVDNKEITIIPCWAVFGVVCPLSLMKYGIHFSDVFDVSPDLLNRYGAFSISLVSNMPLFIDSFLRI